MTKISKEKVIFLTLFFYPELNSTAQLLYELAEDLVNKGVEVDVYAKYPSRWPEKARGFFDGLNVHWIRTTSFPKEVFIGRSLNYLIFFLSLSIKLIIGRSRGKIMVLSSPPFLPLIAFLLNRLKGQKYVYLVHDLYPDVAVQLGYLKSKGLITKLWSRLNGAIIKRAEKIIVLDKVMRRKVDTYADLPDRQKIEIIPNWADGAFLKPIPKENNSLAKKYNLTDKFVVMYAGNFGLTHNLEIFFDVARSLIDTNVMFVLIGDGAKKNKLLELADREKLSNFMILPYFDWDVLPLSLSMADLSLIVLDKGFNGLSVPSKLYNILASGRAVLAALECGGEVEEVLNLANCGVVVPPDDFLAIKTTIRDMIDHPQKVYEMGKNARRYFEAHYDRSLVTAKYFKVLCPQKDEVFLKPISYKYDLSICLVNHNAKEITMDCIGSIYDKTNKLSFEIILVDNNSSDDTLVSIRNSYPEVKIIKNKKNLGFAKANNQAIKDAQGKYIFLLNNDTVLKNNALRLMFECMEKDAKLGLLTCKLFEEDGRIQNNCRSFPLTPFDTFFGRASLFSKLFPDNAITKRNILSNWDYNSAREVDWVSGAAMMIRRNVFEHEELLDENFYMYWEDADISKRIKSAGWKIMFIPDAQIIHFTGKGGGNRSLSLRLWTLYQMHRSAHYYFLKHYYKSPFHPMAIFTYIGMLILVIFKGAGEIFAFPYRKTVQRE